MSTTGTKSHMQISSQIFKESSSKRCTLMRESTLEIIQKATSLAGLKSVNAGLDNNCLNVLRLFHFKRPVMMLTINAIKEQEAVQPPESLLSEQNDGVRSLERRCSLR